MSRKILIVDDEPSMRRFLCESLQQMNRGYSVDTASNGYEALDKLSINPYDLVLTDYMMPKLNGIDFLREMRAREKGCDVVMMTAFGTINNAVEAMKLGAVDYILKPFTVEDIEDVIIRTLEEKRKQNAIQDRPAETPENGAGFHDIIGSSPDMVQIFNLIRMVAGSRATILVSGESGTGKELIARAVHHHSERRQGPFVKINCAAMPEHLIESELFGYEKGAFTGALRQHKGKFEQAHGGTLLLDEISEMALPLQAKLLRVIQEREIERLGGHSAIQVDTRIIATTNRNLKEEVREGRFREDLYYRLNVVPVHLPPLRDRRDDIPGITRHLIEKICRENGKQPVRISDEMIARLQRYNWPGNVRELENRLERAVIVCLGAELSSEHLFYDHVEEPTLPATPAETTDPNRPATVKEVEKALILKTLKEFHGNRMKTADALQISVRTLRNKLNEYRGTGVFNE